MQTDCEVEPLEVVVVRRICPSLVEVVVHPVQEVEVAVHPFQALEVEVVVHPIQALEVEVVVHPFQTLKEEEEGQLCLQQAFQTAAVEAVELQRPAQQEDS